MNIPSPKETLPKLGLADLDTPELPNLEVIVRNAKQDIVAHVAAQIVALIVSPLNRVLYLEAACSSDAGAHALMGSVGDPRGSVEFRFCPIGDADYIDLQPPESPRIGNVRLAVSGWSRHLHHVAMLDRSGELMLAPDDQTLWRKLREKMSCPTLEGWGSEVMPRVQKSGILLECEAFGIPEGMKAYVLSTGAQTEFDTIISAHIRKTGLPRRSAASAAA